MIGKTIVHHKSLKKLGADGMGIFYKIEDIELESSITKHAPE